MTTGACPSGPLLCQFSSSGSHARRHNHATVLFLIRCRQACVARLPGGDGTSIVSCQVFTSVDSASVRAAPLVASSRSPRGRGRTAEAGTRGGRCTCKGREDFKEALDGGARQRGTRRRHRCAPSGAPARRPATRVRTRSPESRFPDSRQLPPPVDVNGALLLPPPPTFITSISRPTWVRASERSQNIPHSSTLGLRESGSAVWGAPYVTRGVRCVCARMHTDARTRTDKGRKQAARWGGGR